MKQSLKEDLIAWFGCFVMIVMGGIMWATVGFLFFHFIKLWH